MWLQLYIQTLLSMAIVKLYAFIFLNPFTTWVTELIKKWHIHAEMRSVRIYLRAACKHAKPEHQDLQSEHSFKSTTNIEWAKNTHLPSRSPNSRWYYTLSLCQSSGPQIKDSYNIFKCHRASRFEMTFFISTSMRSRFCLPRSYLTTFGLHPPYFWTLSLQRCCCHNSHCYYYNSLLGDITPSGSRKKEEKGIFFYRSCLSFCTLRSVAEQMNEKGSAPETAAYGLRTQCPEAGRVRESSSVQPQHRRLPKATMLSTEKTDQRRTEAQMERGRKSKSESRYLETLLTQCETLTEVLSRCDSYFAPLVSLPKEMRKSVHSA